MMKRKQFAATVLIGMLLVGAIGMNFVGTTIASAEAQTTQAVHFSTLIEFLPDDPPGWDGEEPEGMMYTIQDGSWSMANKGYTKSGDEDVTAEVGIMDSAFYPVGWYALWSGPFAFEYESTEGYLKSATVKGYPAKEIYDKETEDYTLLVGINERFFVFVDTNDGDKDTLYDFANLIDYDGIAALGGSAKPPVGTAQPTLPSATTAPAAPAEEDGGENGETPGFEVVFAVVGLLAVMTLLRRRR
jgi:PGF-CTERM protein